mmetsp:Transcript_100899/g.290095  ORF Transcript_100899/g.290095 Transcript_100899/m.290095 type:complete len:220 (-) Transcript_100899:493-1152(-)
MWRTGTRNDGADVCTRLPAIREAMNSPAASRKAPSAPPCPRRSLVVRKDPAKLKRASDTGNAAASHCGTPARPQGRQSVAPAATCVQPPFSFTNMMHMRRRPKWSAKCPDRQIPGQTTDDDAEVPARHGVESVCERDATSLGAGRTEVPANGSFVTVSWITMQCTVSPARASSKPRNIIPTSHELGEQGISTNVCKSASKACQARWGPPDIDSMATHSW